MVATSAVRSASNGKKKLVTLLSKELGYEIRVISGEEEAELTAASALSNFDMYGKRYAMVDIGGGSVEIVTAYENHSHYPTSVYSRTLNSAPSNTARLLQASMFTPGIVTAVAITCGIWIDADRIKSQTPVKPDSPKGVLQSR